MKRLLCLLLFPAMLWGQSHEILRPTADADTSTTSCGFLTHTNSSAMGNAWDAAGLATSVTQTTTGTGGARYRARLFSPWATSAQSAYLALTLNVNSSSPGADSIGNGIGGAELEYSTDAGATYTTLESDSGVGWPQRTHSVALAANTPLGNIRVRVCTDGGVDDSGSGGDSVTLWDIWTDGSYTPPSGAAAPPAAATVLQPTIISVVFLCGKLWG